MAGDKPQDEPRCSFCRKRRFDVKTLVAGPTVFICDECVDICTDIFSEDKAPELHEAIRSMEAALTGKSPTGGLVRCRLCQELFSKEDCVAFPKRGWLCQGCVEIVRQHEVSPKGSAT